MVRDCPILSLPTVEIERWIRLKEVRVLLRNLLAHSQTQLVLEDHAIGHYQTHLNQLMLEDHAIGHYQTHLKQLVLEDHAIGHYQTHLKQLVLEDHVIGFPTHLKEIEDPQTHLKHLVLTSVLEDHMTALTLHHPSLQLLLCLMLVMVVVAGGMYSQLSAWMTWTLSW